MLFSTPFFLLAFLPLFFVVYWFLPARRQILLAGSLVFYGWSEPLFIFTVTGSAVLDWVLGRFIYTLPPGGGKRKLLVGVGVATNLGILVYAKYTVFAIQNLDWIFAHIGIRPLGIPGIVLPLGVSFIVFEKITYLVDLYRHSARPAVSLLDYLNYVFLFPKLLAGPIVKYHDIADQLGRPRHNYDDLRDGTIRVIQGLAKKVLIADTLSPVVDAVFNLQPATLDSATAWYGLLCFTLQIYFDFSGYTDIAIGLARILGFRLLENFNNPYLATSFTDFWRRWHISLSSWIKEYLYIPLGGNHVSRLRSYLNLCICFLLSGLWHGAAWNFVIWGCLHGSALVGDRAFWLQWQKRLPMFVNRALTLFLVVLTWVFFRCRTAGEAFHFVRALARPSAAGNTIFLRTDLPVVITAMAAGIILVFLPLLKRHSPGPAPSRSRLPALACCIVLLFFCFGRMADNTFHPFLYFRF